MDELDLLDHDERIDYSAVPRSRSVTTNDAHERMLVCIASEIASLAGPIAAVASLLNAAGKAGSSADLSGRIAALMPPEPALFPAMIGQLAALRPALLSDIHHFHVRLAFVRQVTLAGETAGPETLAAGGVRAGMLVDAWRELCLAALDTLEAIDAQAGAPSRWPSRLPHLRKVLERAAAGEAPCILADGSVEVPGLVERRRQVRHVVAWPAWLWVDDSWLPAQLFDVSRAGVGVRVDGPFPVVEHVIVLVNDRELTGRIAWSEGDRSGIALSEMLEHDDEMIVAARAGLPAPQYSR